MSKRTAIFLLILNTAALFFGVVLMVFAHRLAAQEIGVTPEKLDVVAARLAAQPSQSAIAGALHADDKYIHSLLDIIHTNGKVIDGAAGLFGVVAFANVIGVVLAFLRGDTKDPAPTEKNRTCPSCGFVFRFFQSAKFLNPYRIPCPECGLVLRTRVATRYILACGAIGLAVAAVAIYCEETGRWQTGDSLRFFAIAVPIAIVSMAALAWRGTKYASRE